MDVFHRNVRLWDDVALRTHRTARTQRHLCCRSYDHVRLRLVVVCGARGSCFLLVCNPDLTERVSRASENNLLIEQVAAATNIPLTNFRYLSAARLWYARWPCLSVTTLCTHGRAAARRG